MLQEEIEEILKQHKLWLENCNKGEYADLRGADLRNAALSGADLRGVDLRGADLRGADLRGANLDFSSWPLWCGSLGVIADKKLVGQLAYHLLDLAKSSEIDVGICDEIRKLANTSNPVVNYGKDKF